MRTGSRRGRPRRRSGRRSLAGAAWTIAAAATLGEPVLPDWPGYLAATLPLGVVAVGAGLVATFAEASRHGEHTGRTLGWAIRLALVWQLLWAAGLVVAALGGPYGAVTAVAATLGAVGLLALGLAGLRFGGHLDAPSGWSSSGASRSSHPWPRGSSPARRGPPSACSPGGAAWSRRAHPRSGRDGARRRLTVAIAGVSLAVAACAGPTPGGDADRARAAEVTPVAMVLVAQNIAFSPAELHVPVGTPIALHFEHRDAGVPHGLVLEAPTNPPTPLYTAEVVTGPTTQDALIPGLIAGAYRFTCQVHPNMSATLVVEAS